MAVCFLNDISTLETEQLIIPEKLGSGENRGDFDYPAEKVRYLWFTSSRKDNAGCGRVYCGVYRCRCMPNCMLRNPYNDNNCSGAYNNLQSGMINLLDAETLA